MTNQEKQEVKKKQEAVKKWNIAQAEAAEALNCKHSNEWGRCLLSDSGEYCVLGPCLEYEERKNDLQNH